MFLVSVPGTITDTSLPQPGVADPLLVGANGGVKTLFDLVAATSWAKQGAPVNGDTITDLSGSGAGNLTAEVTATGPTFSGGGFDFTPVTGKPNDVLAPACLASIKAAANQYFLVCAYVKLPTSGNWSTSGALEPFFCATAAAGGYASEADLVTIAAQAAPTITARRQTNGGSTYDAPTISGTSLTMHQGLVTQIAFWRNATNQTLQLTSSAGTSSATAVTGSNNTGDFSAKQPRWGVVNSFSSTSTAGLAWRLYRGFIEDLSASGRSPAAVLAADYATVAARFS